MQHSTSSLLKSILASGASAAFALCAALPAAAHGHGGPHASSGTAHVTRSHTAPRTYAAPRTYRAPRTYAAPRTYRAPRTYAAPHYSVRHPYAAPRTYRAPRTYAAPHYSVHRTYRARTYAAPRTYSAPRYRHEVIRQRFGQNAPFMERARVAPRTVHAKTAPFMQYVRMPRHERSYAAAPAVVRSPLMRAVYAPRVRRTVAYHPAYLTGRVVSIRRNVVILQPPTGSAIPVSCNCYDRFRTGSYVTVPAVYTNGGYSAYAYSPQYYPQVAEWYVPQSAYTATSIWDNDADEYGGNFDGDQDDNAQYGYYDNAYSQPYDNNYSQPYYANSSPYDNCMWSDNDGDENTYCAAGQTAGYYGSPYGYSGGYGSMYAPQQVQGLVVAKTGSILMVLGANGLKPIVVDAASALQNGYAVNGPVAVGQVIDAYGYYTGNTFMATALM